MWQENINLVNIFYIYNEQIVRILKILYGYYGRVP